MSLFEDLYGRKPPTIPAYTRGPTCISALDENLTTRDELLHNLKANLVAVENRMTQ